MAQFNRPYTTFCWSTTVNIAQSGTELFDVEWYHDLEIWVTGHSRSFERKLGCGFLFTFHSNYGSILHHLRDEARYWSFVNRDFFIPPCIQCPIRGVPVGILPYRLVWKNYPMVKKFWGYVQPFRDNTSMWQTDRRTERQTLRRHSPHYAYTTINMI